jgi:hypothetical protein
MKLFEKGIDGVSDLILRGVLREGEVEKKKGNSIQ